MIYLDNAATSFQKPLIIHNTLYSFSKSYSVNAGHGGHKLALYGSNVIDQARETIAKLFSIEKPHYIGFSSNTTAAINMGVGGIIKSGDHVITSSLEHNSVSRCIYGKEKVDISIVWANKEGFINPNDVTKLINPRTKMIVINHVSNVIGTIQNIREIGKIANEKNIIFMVDAAQSAGAVDIDVRRDSIDVLAFAGHKGLLGPLGTGGLYVNRDKVIEFSAFIKGGTGSNSESLQMPDVMPDMIEVGTKNLPAIAALEKGVQYVMRKGTKNILEHEQKLVAQAHNGLKSINNITVYGSDDFSRRAGVISFNIDQLESTETTNILNTDYAIAVRGGLHCSFLAHQSLHTLKTGTARASFGYFTTKYDVEALIQAVGEIAKKVILSTN